MRLLYHRIKPVVVFDGIMPEVKRRELQRRRDRREKLWRGTGENGEDADLALKRTAKKILVKQLKDWREKKLEAAAVKSNNKRSPSKRSSAKNGSGTAGGAFAAGFSTGEDEANVNTQSTQSDEVANNDDNVVNMESKGGSNNEDAISIKSSSEDEDSKPKAKAIHDINNNKNEDDAYESENDWGMSIAIQSSINDSTKLQKQQQIQYEDFSHQPVEAIASLPNETRSQWMESQYKAQRIQSRKECIGAAANPEDYSSTQLRNFLKGSRLNKKMGEIGKLAGKLGVDNDDDDNGFVNVEDVNNGNGDGGSHRRVLKRPNNKDDDDSDDDIFSNCESATTNKVSMKVLFGEDDDESGDDNGMEVEGGGFLVPNSDLETNQGKKAATAASNEIVIDDSSPEDDSSTQEANDVVAASNDDGVNSNEKEGGDAAINTFTSVAARSRLMALSSADQEWANWGEVVTRNNTSMEQYTKSTITKASDAAASSSESDSDEEPTFLPLQQHPKAHSSLVNSAARPVASSDKPISQTICLLDDDTDDDIEWEDGGQEENTSLNQSSSQLLCHQDDNEDEEDEDINWEDGGQNDEGDDEEDDIDVELADNKSRQFQSSTQALGNDDVVILNDKDSLRSNPKLLEEGESLNEASAEMEKVIDDTKSGVDAMDREKEAFDVDEAQEKSYQSDSSSNAFEIEDFNSDDPTTTALRHAQETASRLTDWAGRAVQRAIAAHIEEKGGSPPKKTTVKEKSQMVDLTADDDKEDEDGNASDVEETPVNKGTDAAENTKASSTGPHTTVDLFDTSLEGLNKVHHDIVEEEKLMERDMSTITDEMKLDILNLLQLCGIPWVESPSEAEAQCATLQELGLVDGIVTEDSDVFVFGGRKVYKNFFNEQKYVEAYFASDIKKELGLGRSQLVALAMLLGGDYTDGVKGVGIVNGMEILQSFAIEDGKEGIRDGLQRFREWLDGLDDPLAEEDESATFLSKVKLFHKKHQSARTRWIAPADFPSPAIIDGYMKPAVDSSAANFTWGKPDIEGLRQFCANSIGWEDEETDRVVQPVLKILESGSTQTRIESYFMKYDDNIKFAEVKSKRLKAVLDDVQTGEDAEGSNKRRRSD